MKTQQVTLTQVSRSEKVSASDKPYTRLLLKCSEFGDRFLSGFGNASNANWKEGDKVEIQWEEVEKDGNKYLNFSTPKREDKMLADFNSLALKVGLMNTKLDKIIDHLSGENRLDRTSDGSDMPNF
jgi:hypothetical protein